MKDLKELLQTAQNLLKHISENPDLVKALDKPKVCKMCKNGACKCEVVKEEKGVHSPQKSHHFFNSDGKRDTGLSVAGAKARAGDAIPKFDSKSGIESAKDIHREKLNELKSMPKPKLGKNEIIVNDLKKSWEPKFLGKEEKGVHRAYRGGGESETAWKGGQSKAGARATSTEFRKPDACPACKMPKDKKEGTDQSKQMHREKLEELKSMPKPKLGKEEKKADDSKRPHPCSKCGTVVAHDTPNDGPKVCDKCFSDSKKVNKEEKNSFKAKCNCTNPKDCICINNKR